MADTQQDKTGGNASSGSSTAAANKAAKGGDHDRVAMLSLKADGTPDQLNPEIISPKEQALAATTEQFKQQAVSAADVELRGASDKDRGTTVEDPKPDPEIKKLEDAHAKAEKGAESDAKKAVEALTNDKK